MKQHIARQLLSIGAVELRPHEPFTWASGVKSPIYCDNRLTMSYPSVRKEIAKGLAGLIEEFYPDCQVVAGTATAGIPHAARSPGSFHGAGQGGGCPGRPEPVPRDLAR